MVLTLCVCPNMVLGAREVLGFVTGIVIRDLSASAQHPVLHLVPLVTVVVDRAQKAHLDELVVGLFFLD